MDLGWARVWVCRAAAFLVPFVGYLLTLAPSVQSGDSAEFSMAVATLGVPHSPGYPVYVLASYPFTLLPIGDVGFRLNLASAVYGATCALVIFDVLLALKVGKLPALIASQFAAFSYFFWSQSVVAEIYTFDVLLLMLTLRALVGFRERRSTRWLAALGAFVGLGIADRSGFGLYLPFIVALLVTPRARPTPRQAAVALLLFAAGLSTYLYVPIRSTAASAYVWGGGYSIDGTFVRPDLTSFHTLWNFFSLRPFRWMFFVESRSGYAREVWTMTTWAWAALLGGGMLLGLLGIARAWIERRAEILVIAAMAIVYSGALALYAVPDRNTMFVPFIVLWSVPVGVGLGFLWADSVVLKASVSLSVAAIVIVNFGLVDQSQATQPRADAQRTLNSMDGNAIAIGYWPKMAVMEYLQRVEGERRDLRLVQIWAAGLRGARSMIDANRSARPVYLELLGDGPGPSDATPVDIPGWVVFGSGESQEANRKW